MDIVIGNDVYHRCYGNKFIKDIKPHFDLLHPDKLAPFPIYNHEHGKMIEQMIPCEITRLANAPDAERVYYETKKTDLNTWHYYKEKYKEWRVENAKRKLEYSEKMGKIEIDTKPHYRLSVPFMQRFEVEK